MTAPSGRAARAVSSSAGEEAPLVEEGVLGCGDHGPVRRAQGDLGRRRRLPERQRRRERKATGLVVVTAPTVVAGCGPPEVGRSAGRRWRWPGISRPNPSSRQKLEWMRGFVREEVFPLETLDLTYDQVRVVIRPLQERVKAEGSVGGAPAARRWAAWGSGR